MSLLLHFIDIILHLDKYFLDIVQQYGVWAYGILFLIIFCETGLVVTPFLPGDSLLFITGAIAAMGALDLHLLAPLLIVAAILGDNTNYWIGRFVGIKFFDKSQPKLYKRAYYEYTQKFYERHGGKTVVLARFLPIVRTFAPFVAGIGRMIYSRFLTFSVTGGILWIDVLLCLGYFFGQIPTVKNNVTIMIFAIIFLSVLPGMLGYMRHRCQKINV